jgi:hypothetical protein
MKIKNKFFKKKKKTIVSIFIKKIKKKYLFFLINLIFQKKKLKQEFFLQRLKIQKILFKNCKLIQNLLMNKIYIRMNVFKVRKNTFLNFSNIFSGKIYSNYSCGHYYRNSLRKTYYAVESLLLKSHILEKKFFHRY